ncbi:MAG: GNAT family N-acetyltransferase [Verrucomicrobia bacterium]|nr:GNAT family N-acetyltransferase [Verrucomicrobiota bacterium]
MSQHNVEIDLLKYRPEALPVLARIWQEGLGRLWQPGITIEEVEERFRGHMKDEGLPQTFAAFVQGQPVGMCSLRATDLPGSSLTPWFGAFVVDPAHKNRGVGRLLIQFAQARAKNMGFERLYLFAFDRTIPIYYERFGWKTIAFESVQGHAATVMEALI